MQYAETYQRSISESEAFWAERANDIPWFTAPQTILSKDANDVARWYADGTLNTCFCAVDYHVQQGRGDQTALIYDSPVTQTVSRYSYAELMDWTARVAGGLVELGVAKGDVVIIYMPMVPETIVAMLACARIGAVHSVVFGGFAADELAMRIDDATPKVVLAATCGIETERVIPYQPLLNGALDLARHKPAHVVMLERPQAPAELNAPRDIDWASWAAAAEPVACVPVAATDPLHPVYLGYYRQAQGYCARQWRPCSCAEIQHVGGL